MAKVLAYSNKPSSSVIKLVNYGQKSFITLAPDESAQHTAIMPSLLYRMNIIMLSVVMLNIIMLSVVMLSIIMLRAVMLNFIMQSAILLNVIMMSVVGPSNWPSCPGNLRQCNTTEMILVY